MVDACKLLGVDVMTGHWEFTSAPRASSKSWTATSRGRIDFLAQNIKTADFGDAVFPPYVIKNMNGVPVAIVGQAFPYTPIANPRYMIPDWTFGIQEETLQKTVDEARAKGAQAVILLSHNGMDVDLKLATRVRGIDAILGGHTHDGVPAPTIVSNAGGKTLVTNAGSNGKFLGVLDFEVKSGKLADFRYKLLPVFANLLPADPGNGGADPQGARALCGKARRKARADRRPALPPRQFQRHLRSIDTRRPDGGKDTPIAFSPGFRWGTSLLPGEPILMEHLMDQTAITYPYTTVTEMTGETVKIILEDVGDNLFNPDPYYQQGGDMVRVGGLRYTCDPNGNPVRASAACRSGQAAGSGQDIQSRGLGTGIGRSESEGRRADLGSDGALPAQPQADQTAATRTPAPEGHARK